MARDMFGGILKAAFFTWCRLLGRPVIIKSTGTAHSALGKKLLLNEAAVATSLASLWEEVVPALIASGFIGSSFFINVFQKIEGRMLRKRDVTKALDALRKVHEHGILHGDVKPENFLVSKQGAVFVIDFGLSRPCTNTAELSREKLELQGFW
jgi:serine/threonine protein kinase